jgi:hypothetical protein
MVASAEVVASSAAAAAGAFEKVEGAGLGCDMIFGA